MKKLLLFFSIFSLVFVAGCSKSSSGKYGGSSNDNDKVVETDENDDSNKGSNDLEPEDDNDDSGWSPIEWL